MAFHITRRVASAGSAVVAGGAAAATLLALSPVPALAAVGSGSGSNPSSATGLQATGAVLRIPPTPTVSSTGATQDKSLIALPQNPLLTAKVLHVTANGNNSTARASVVDLSIDNGVIKASLITASCNGDTGASHLAGLTIAGQNFTQKLTAKTKPDTTISLPGVAKVEFNKQVKNSEGGMTVTALEVQLLSSLQTIDVSMASCGKAAASVSKTPSQSSSGTPSPSSSGTASPSSSGKPSPAPSEAPAPTPVHTTLAVTG